MAHPTTRMIKWLIALPLMVFALATPSSSCLSETGYKVFVRTNTAIPADRDALDKRGSHPAPHGDPSATVFGSLH